MQKASHHHTLNTLELVQRLCEGIGTDLQESSKDIEQGLILMEQAVTQLNNHFMALQTQIQTIPARGSKEIKLDAVSSTTIQAEVRHIMIALQFHDLVAQLLNRVLAQLQKSNDFLEELRDKALKSKSPESDSLSLEIQQVHEQLNQYNNDVHSAFSSPIRQRTLQSGGIELF